MVRVRVRYIGANHIMMYISVEVQNKCTYNLNQSASTTSSYSKASNGPTLANQQAIHRTARHLTDLQCKPISKNYIVQHGIELKQRLPTTKNTWNTQLPEMNN